MTGPELRAIRKALKWPQSRMAEALGMTTSYYGLMERGLKSIEKRTAKAARFIAEHPEDDRD